MTVLCALALLFWSCALAGALLDVRAVRELEPAEAPHDAPAVCAIVPARNEAHQIEACLRSLLSQRWPRLRVVCVDDRSDDGTFEVAARIGDERLVVVRGTELPAGWLGKNHGNAQGVLQAGDAPFLLFTDADTVHAPGALPAAMAAMRRSGADLFTLLTDLVVATFWEKALLPGIIGAIAAAFPLRRVNDPRSRIAIANGQYLLARRSAYEAVGGHAAIRDRVGDDLELARLIKGRGYRLRAENGRAFVSVRMYTSLREIWWGFVKNASAGAGGPWVSLLGAAVMVGSVAPFGVLPWALAAGKWALAAVALGGCAAAVALRAYVSGRLFRVPRGYSLLVPVNQVFLAGIVIHSAVRALTGRGPRWKGRSYPGAR